jgi:hypothetical protein
MFSAPLEGVVDGSCHESADDDTGEDEKPGRDASSGRSTRTSVA